jgi:pyruvate formate lyase activating enzyme
MIPCRNCGNTQTAQVIGYCADCLRDMSDLRALSNIHLKSRQQFGLPVQPPRDKHGITCHRCANNCQLISDAYGFCGLRYNKNGILANHSPRGSALAYMYLDTLPTNCCAAWFCRGKKEDGYNLAVFFYGCNFDCLFCQNSSHKNLHSASVITGDDIVAAALEESVRCVCFFGGSPEPQLPFAIRVAQRIIKESKNQKHICWEWNGCGDNRLVQKAAETAYLSRGTVKFDLKAHHPNLTYALCGISNKQSYNNFTFLAHSYDDADLLTATTLLVPYYIDHKEIGKIAQFIAGFDKNIPYSLLVFHPDYYLRDLPITPLNQVQACYKEATRYLNRVNIGNKHLLPYAPDST